MGKIIKCPLCNEQKWIEDKNATFWTYGEEGGFWELLTFLVRTWIWILFIKFLYIFVARDIIVAVINEIFNHINL